MLSTKGAINFMNKDVVVLFVMFQRGFMEHCVLVNIGHFVSLGQGVLEQRRVIGGIKGLIPIAAAGDPNSAPACSIRFAYFRNAVSVCVDRSAGNSC